jgi:hypothetical protein
VIERDGEIVVGVRVFRLQVGGSTVFRNGGIQFTFSFKGLCTFDMSGGSQIGVWLQSIRIVDKLSPLQ